MKAVIIFLKLDLGFWPHVNILFEGKMKRTNQKPKGEGIYIIYYGLYWRFCGFKLQKYNCVGQYCGKRG